MKKAISLTFLLLMVAPAAAPDDTTASNGQSETQRIIAFLNQTIVWYRGQVAMQQMATEPSDVLYVNDNREIADEAVRQSFDFARARAQILTTQAIPTAVTSDKNSPATRYQSLAATANRLEQQVKDRQAQVEELRRKIQTSSSSARTRLEASLSEVQSEIDLLQTRRDALKNMLQFLSSSNTNALGSGTLQSQIDELAKTVPVALVDTKTQQASTQNTSASTQAATAAAAASSAQKRVEPNGILGLITDLIALTRKKQTIEQAMQSTDSLSQAAKNIRGPLMTELRALMAKGDEVSNAPDTTDAAALAQQKKQLDALTAQFKQYSAAVLPLGKQNILLDVYKRTLGNWRDSVVSQHRSELRALILRLVILGIIIGLITMVSEIWRRATFRYVQDTRRRYQFLLLRRIAVWIVIAIVVAFAFAEELGTLATFAGLLTAGVAVALQNVIQSVAGYFFLIGRYGVRVGDRVQIGGVTGDVIDIGLVRLHIMEVISDSSASRPTGRVVVFSNAVVFQPNAGLFKQIPGTNFVWHELTLTLSADSNYQDVEERLMGAVQKVYSEYKSDMDTQRRRMEQSLSGVSVRALQPESRLRLTQKGLDVVIRYPVLLSNAASIDDSMTRALLDAISREPRLKLVGSGTPNIQEVTEHAPVAS
jgi:small-conductance mechanosensitive channel